MLSNLGSAYKKLLERYKDIAVLGSTEAIVQWDMETKMPPKAVQLRSEQLALLSEIHHKMATAPALGRMLDEILKHPQYETLSEEKKRNVQLIKKNYDEQTKLPSKLVSAITKQQAISVNIWKKAKSQQDYALFKPELEKLVNLNKQAAQILMKVKETKVPYDALVDFYEPKMTAQAVSVVFGDLQAGLEKLMEKITHAASQPDVSILAHEVSVDKQKKIANLLMRTLGYEVPPSPAAGGRLDETEHPFTTGYYDDVRITTHYHTNTFASSIFSVLHETGHALYEQALPQEWKYQPIGAGCSMGIHESQSRFYENVIGRSQEFWTAILPKVKAAAAPSLNHLEMRKFIHAVNAVKPSKIRIEADEVTYCLHIIIRFQIEREIFADRLGVDELPQVWNEKYKQTLGVKIENDSEGVMQDTHWASGYYGYFPTYALGNIYSGQIIAALQKASPAWRSELAQGNLANTKKWLNRAIYSRGNLYDPAVLVKKATGTRLTVKPYLSYLEEKFKGLYEF
jgi:carboxypeptidase Taq